jgi:DNA-binding response OmpR family regulator
MTAYRPPVNGSFAELCRKLLSAALPNAEDDYIERQVHGVLEMWSEPNFSASLGVPKTVHPTARSASRQSDKVDSPSRLLVVEDDPDIALALRLLFSRAGYEVAYAGDGRTGLKEAYAEHPDLVVLDVGLPEMDGWQVLERLRDVSDVPVLVITAHGQEAEKVRGVGGGAEDYLTRPFANNELLARVEALLRRSSGGQNRWARQIYDDGLVHLDPTKRRVYVKGEEKRLNPTEFRLLNALVGHAGAVLSPKQLLTQAWDDPTGIGQERVKFAVLRLRRKLGWSDPDESPIESVRGFGYRYHRP